MSSRERCADRRDRSRRRHLVDTSARAAIAYDGRKRRRRWSRKESWSGICRETARDSGIPVEAENLALTYWRPRVWSKLLAVSLLSRSIRFDSSRLDSTRLEIQQRSPSHVRRVYRRVRFRVRHSKTLFPFLFFRAARTKREGRERATIIGEYTCFARGAWLTDGFRVARVSFELEARKSVGTDVRCHARAYVNAAHRHFGSFCAIKRDRVTFVRFPFFTKYNPFIIYIYIYVFRINF